MKFKSTALAAGLAMVAASASAQSSVTLYGSLDQYFNHMKSSSGTVINALQDGSTLRSRLGFKGDEDMGGGLHAKFNLEMGIGATTGDQVGNTAPVTASAVTGPGVDPDFGDEHVDRRDQVGVQFVNPDPPHTPVCGAPRPAAQRQQRLTFPDVARRTPHRFQALPHRDHQFGVADQRRTAPGTGQGLISEGSHVGKTAAERDQVGTCVAEGVTNAAPRPEFAADGLGVDAMVGHPGSNHAGAHGIVGQDPRYRADVANH